MASAVTHRARSCSLLLQSPCSSLEYSEYIARGCDCIVGGFGGVCCYLHCWSSVYGVSVEINVSYLDAALLDEEIEIEAKALRVGKSIAVVSVELRKKGSGKIIAQGRHTKYLPVSSKL